MMNYNSLVTVAHCTSNGCNLYNVEICTCEIFNFGILLYM